MIGHDRPSLRAQTPVLIEVIHEHHRLKLRRNVDVPPRSTDRKTEKERERERDPESDLRNPEFRHNLKEKTRYESLFGGFSWLRRTRRPAITRGQTSGFRISKQTAFVLRCIRTSSHAVSRWPCLGRFRSGYVVHFSAVIDREQRKYSKRNSRRCHALSKLKSLATYGNYLT